jgi:triacylglycerol lipase
VSPEASPPPADLASVLRGIGPVIDLQATKPLFAPRLAIQPTDGVARTLDLPYGDDVRHRLDVYAPAAPKSAAPKSAARPIVIVMHGGGFIRGDKSERTNAGFYFARRGFLTLIPNYRLAPAHRWPSGAEDVAAIVQWTKAEARRFDGDPDRLFLVGESAGAAHIATALLRRRFHPPGGLGVAGAVLVSGVYNVDLEHKARRQFALPQPDPRNGAYFGEDASRYPEMSTVDHIDAAPVPLLITFAELDPPQMQVQAGELFSRLAGKHGFAPDIAVIRGHNHHSQCLAINTGDEALTGVIVEFIARHDAASDGPSVG